MKLLLSFAALAALSLLIMAAEPAPPAAGMFRTDEEGFVLNWLVLEPIPLTNLQHTETGVKAIMARDDLKEALAAMPKAGERVNVADAKYEWHARNDTNYVVNLTGFASGLGKPTVSVLFYGVAYITAAEEMKDARLAIGSDDDSVWWVNGEEVISAYGSRQTSVDDNVSKRLTLKKGINIVRFAVVQGDGPSDCCARFYDARQKVITNITVSLEPPGAAGK